ncbi:MAG: FAD-dependent oxidoreductase [Firmicutes bacterium]|nr:FAD-dependent oxidoreductase [Bacillota bacterium]
MYDIAIIGGGPAGLSAAVNACRRNKKTILISKEEQSSKLTQAHSIDNYLGLPEINGADLARRMKEHALGLGTVFLKDEIQSVYRDGRNFFLTGRENTVEAAAVILAIGIAIGKEIEGEADFVGRGVSYCATCDGMFFKGKTVALIGYIPEAEREVNFLAEICQKVYFLPQYGFKGELDPKVKLWKGKPLRISGTEKVELLKTGNGDLAVDGVFIERAGRPADQLIEGLEMENGFIITDTNQATNIEGVFAAGDCTGRPWQIGRAVGQGQIAALAVVNYLET